MTLNWSEASVLEWLPLKQGRPGMTSWLWAYCSIKNMSLPPFQCSVSCLEAWVLLRIYRQCVDFLQAGGGGLVAQWGLHLCKVWLMIVIWIFFICKVGHLISIGFLRNQWSDSWKLTSKYVIPTLKSHFFIKAYVCWFLLLFASNPITLFLLLQSIGLWTKFFPSLLKNKSRIYQII